MAKTKKDNFKKRKDCMTRGSNIHYLCEHMINCVKLKKNCQCNWERLIEMNDPLIMKKMEYLLDFCYSKNREFYGSEIHCTTSNGNKTMICDILLINKSSQTLTMIELKTGKVDSKFQRIKTRFGFININKYSQQVKRNVKIWNENEENGPRITEAFIYYFDVTKTEKVQI